jgi:hypothetical protein
MTANAYIDIIKRLLSGWKPNHEQGKLNMEWWHPHKPYNFIELMTTEELEIVKALEDELDRAAIKEAVERNNRNAND